MCAEDNPHRSRWLVAAVAAASLIVWWLLHRWWFMAGDDYNLITLGGDAAGRFSFQDWVGFLANEWGAVNGRTSDSLLRLVLRPGPWFYPLFAPVMLTATGLGIGVWLSVARPRGQRTVRYLAGLLAVPFLLWLAPAFSGDAVFWTAGAMNYVLPLGAVAFALAGVIRVLHGRETPWWLVAVTAAGLMLTDSLQEISSTALAAVAVVVIVTARGRLPVKAWVLTGASLLAFAIHMSAPGLWARSGQVTELTSAGGPGVRLLHAVALASTNLVTRTAWLWVVWAVLLVWLVVTATRRRSLHFTAAGAVAAVPIVAGCYVHRAPIDDALTQPLSPAMLGLAAVLAVVLAAAFLLSWWVLAEARPQLGWVPLTAWAAFVGSHVFVLGSGVTSARAHFLPAAFLLITILAVLFALTGDLSAARQRALAGTLVVGMALPGAVWADSAWVGLQANYRVVQAEVIEPLLSAAPGSTVALPSQLPHPEMSYGFAFLMPRYEHALKTYFNLSKDLIIINR
ncbi:MAG: DUF6056 family protein [Propionibacteriaceae bacterium]|nr:DUF6056 family protein [Propionibacteriaceae bacterium]